MESFCGHGNNNNVDNQVTRSAAKNSIFCNSIRNNSSHEKMEQVVETCPDCISDCGDFHKESGKGVNNDNQFSRKGMLLGGIMDNQQEVHIISDQDNGHSDKCEKCSSLLCQDCKQRRQSCSLSRRLRRRPPQFFSESAKLFASHTLVFCLAVGIYSNSLSGEFVHDDVVSIVRNPDVNLGRSRSRVETSESAGWWSLWKNDYWGMPMSSPLSHKSYRPLTVLTFRLNYWMCGESLCPEVFHWTNVLIHALASCLSLHLCRGVLRMKLVSSALVACLFAVHPVHTEAVAGITGRADALACLMMLVSFILYHRSIQEFQRKSLPDKDSILSRVEKYCGGDDKSKKCLDGNQNDCCRFHSNPDCDTGSEPAFAKVAQEISIKSEASSELKESCRDPSTLSTSSSRPAMSSKSYAFLCASGLMGCAAMLAKENGITVLGINLLHDLYTYRQRSRRRKDANKHKAENESAAFLKRRIGFTFTLIVLSLAFRIALMNGTFPRFGPPDNPAAYSPSKTTRLLTFLYLPVLNFWLILCPSVLSYDWQMGSVPLVETLYDKRNLASFSFYFSLLLLTWTGYSTKCSKNRSMAVVLSLLFTTLPFLPASNILFPVGFVVAERVLYTTSLGVCILVVCGLECILSKVKVAMRRYFCTNSSKHIAKYFCNMFVIICVGVLLGSMSLRTWQRNQVWQSRLSLFSSGIRDAPDNAKMHYNYANIQKDLGNRVKAIEHYSIAVRLWPEYASAHNNLGTLLMGNPAAAEHQFLKAIKAGNQAHGGAHFNLGVLYMNNEKFPEAATHFKKSLIIDPSHPEAFQFLSLCINRVHNGRREEGENKQKSVRDAAENNRSVETLANNTDPKRPEALPTQSVTSSTHHSNSSVSRISWGNSRQVQKQYSSEHNSHASFQNISYLDKPKRLTYYWEESLRYFDWITRA